MLLAHGLYTHIRANDWRSLALFLGFVAAIEVVAYGAYLPTRFLLSLPTMKAADPLAGFMAGGFVVGALWYVLLLGQHLRKAAEAAGFALTAPQAERRVRRLLEPLAIAAGLPTPRLAVIEQPALNAFACGLTRRDAVIVVTRGLIEALDDAELAAVLAHELTHIRNGDIRLMASAHAAQRAVSGVARRFAPLMNKRAWLVLLISPFHLMMLAALTIYGFIGATLAALARILISRSREFVADAGAVTLTKNPEALVSALRKIEGHSRLDNAPAEIEAMLIDGPATGALASHPSVGERVAALQAHAGMLVEITAPPSPHPFAAIGAVVGAALSAARRPAEPRAEIERQQEHSRRVIRWAGAIVAAVFLFNVVSALFGMAMFPTGSNRRVGAHPAQPVESWQLRRH